MKQLLFPCLLALLVSSGCATRQEMRFHVAAADVESANPELKFYRITIKSRASNQKTSLETGWYDARAVRELYGEVTPAALSRPGDSAPGQHRFLLNPRTGRWQPAGDSELFTVVFGTDAKAIAQTIRTYAESGEAGDAFSRLLAASAGRDRYVEKIQADQIGQESLKQLRELIQTVKTNSDGLTKVTATDTPQSVGSKLLALAQAVAKRLGSSQSLRTDSLANGLDDAQRQLDLLRERQP